MATVPYLERHAVEVPTLLGDWSKATRRVWLGGLENVEVGYLAADVSLPSDATVGVIEGIYVNREARGCGIVELMMSVAVGWFRSHECVGVDATALPGGARHQEPLRGTWTQSPAPYRLPVAADEEPDTPTSCRARATPATPTDPAAGAVGL